MTKDVVISVRGLQVMDNESAEDIDLYTGIVSELPLEGRLFFCIIFLKKRNFSFVRN